MDEAGIGAALQRGAAFLGGRRRLVAAALVAVAIAAALRALAPATPPTVAVWAAARDLSGGSPLAAADLRRLALPSAAVPHDAIRSTESVVGRLLAAPMRAGEPLTDVRLLEPSLLAALPDAGLVAVPVRVADGPAAAALVRAGDVVSVLATGDPSSGEPPGATGVIATGLKVLAVPGRSGLAGGDGGGLVVLAVTPAQATALARAATTTRLSLELDRP